MDSQTFIHPELRLPGLPWELINTMFDQNGSQQQCTILVGSERTRFCVAINHISYFQYFRRAFFGGFIEAETKILELPEETPAAFKLFLQWAYQGIHQDISLTVCLQAWLMADKFLIPQLPNLLFREAARQISFMHYAMDLPGSFWGPFREWYQLIEAFPHRLVLVLEVSSQLDRLGMLPDDMIQLRDDISRVQLFQALQATEIITPGGSTHVACRAVLIALILDDSSPALLGFSQDWRRKAKSLILGRYKHDLLEPEVESTYVCEKKLKRAIGPEPDELRKRRMSHRSCTSSDS